MLFFAQYIANILGASQLGAFVVFFCELVLNVEKILIYKSLHKSVIGNAHVIEIQQAIGSNSKKSQKLCN